MQIVTKNIGQLYIFFGYSDITLQNIYTKQNSFIYLTCLYARTTLIPHLKSNLKPAPCSRYDCQHLVFTRRTLQLRFNLKYNDRNKGLRRQTGNRTIPGVTQNIAGAQRDICALTFRTAGGQMYPNCSFYCYTLVYGKRLQLF